MLCHNLQTHYDSVGSRSPTTLHRYNGYRLLWRLHESGIICRNLSEIIKHQIFKTSDKKSGGNSATGPILLPHY